MGNPLGRIEREFVLQKMEEEHLDLIVHGERKTGRVKVLQVENEELLRVQMVEDSVDPFKKGEQIRLFFDFYDHTMTFEGSFQEIGDGALISIPKTVVKNLQRKFERVPPPDRDIHLSFDLESSRIELDFPRTSRFQQVDDEEMVYSPNFQGSTIQQLLGQFNEVIRAHAEESKIIMFRERKPEGYEELVVSSTGKAIFIPDTSRFFPSLEESEGRDMIVEEELPSEEDAEDFFGKSLSELRSWLTDLGQKGILSELDMPIRFREYVVGMIKLRTGVGRGLPFDINVYDLCNEFCSVLIHALKQSGYFSGGTQAVESYQPEIINISASGLLFTHSSTELSSQVSMYTDLTLNLTISGRPMKIDSRVMRKYNEDNHVYYGLQFMEMKPEDFRYLFEMVYGRSFSEKDDRLWEGGAKPPEVVL
jgi:hypothetical protein